MKINGIKALLISLAIINILLIFDIAIFSILGLYFPIIESFNSLYFKTASQQPIIGSDLSIFYFDLIIKLIFFSQLFYFIIFKKNNLYFQILIRCTLVFCGLSLLYNYLIGDILNLNISRFFNYTLLCLTIVLVHDYFKEFNTKRQFHRFFSKLTSIYLIFVFVIPIIVFEVIHFISTSRTNKVDIENSTQAVIDYELKTDSLNILYLNNESTVIARQRFNEKSKDFNVSFFDYLYMYSQIKSKKSKGWDEFKLSGVKLYSYNQSDYWKIKAEHRAIYYYYCSKPLFNISNDLACIFVYRIFVPEASRYANIETFVVEKKNNKWNVKNNYKRNTGF